MELDPFRLALRVERFIPIELSLFYGYLDCQVDYKLVGLGDFLVLIEA